MQTKHYFQLTKSEIASIFKIAKRVRTPAFDFLFAPKRKNFGRLLVVISSHVDIAAQRNLLRRRLKAIFYEHGFFDCAYDCIIIAKQESTQNSFESLQKIMTEAYQKMGFIPQHDSDAENN